MSRQIGMDAIHCRPTPRPAHVEYSMEYHNDLIRKVTAPAARVDPVSRHAANYDVKSREVLRRFYDAWDFDFL